MVQMAIDTNAKEEKVNSFVMVNSTWIPKTAEYVRRTKQHGLQKNRPKVLRKQSVQSRSPHLSPRPEVSVAPIVSLGIKGADGARNDGG